MQSIVKQEEVSTKKERYGIWLGLPKKARKPPTLGELATDLDVSIKSLERWQYDPIVVRSKQNAVKILASNEDHYDIIQTMISKAKQGSQPHIKLYLEWQGEVGPINRKQDKEEPRKFEVKIVS